MNKYLIFVSYLILIGLYSCDNSQLPLEPLEHFKDCGIKKLIISKRINLDSLDILKPHCIIKKEGVYIIKDQTNSGMIKAWDPSSGKVYKGVHKGNGPNEIISMSSMQLYEGDVYVYDIMRKMMKKISLCDVDTTVIISDDINMQIKNRPFIVALMDGKWLASGYLQKSWINYYSKENQLISSLPFPSFPATDGLDDETKSVIYMSTMLAIKPDGTKVACATQMAGVVSISDCKGDTLVETTRLQYFPAIINLNSVSNVTYSKDSKVGFCDVVCDNDYIYLMYSGRTEKEFGLKSHHCQHILVYDWGGNPIKHYELETPLFTMNYDSDMKIIYGIGYDPEGCIIEYDLNE